MKHPLFYTPRNKIDIFHYLEKSGGQILAGGTDMIPRMRKGVGGQTSLINISGVSDLHFIQQTETELQIGALVTHSELKESPAIQKLFPALEKAAASVGSLQTRNRGTLGGNIANASPAADTVTALVALNAKLILECASGVRRVAISDFFRGPGKTGLKPNEIISTVVLPIPSENSRSSFLKLGKRKAMAISVINTAINMELTSSKIIKSVQVAVGSVAPTVVRCPSVENFLIGKSACEKTFKHAATFVLNDIAPIDDVRASRDYRKDVAVSLVYQVLIDTFEQRKGEWKR